MQETQVRSLGQEDPLEKEYNPLQYSRLGSPMEEPGQLQSMGSQSVRHTHSHQAIQLFPRSAGLQWPLYSHTKGKAEGQCGTDKLLYLLLFHLVIYSADYSTPLVKVITSRLTPWLDSPRFWQWGCFHCFSGVNNYLVQLHFHIVGR